MVCRNWASRLRHGGTAVVSAQRREPSMGMADVYLSQFQSMSNFIDNQVVDVPEDVFHRRPGSSLNPISFSYFHLLRVWDVDLNWIVKGLGPKNDAWHRGGFAEKSGYSPDGKGVRGMGIGTGFKIGRASCR